MVHPNLEAVQRCEGFPKKIFLRENIATADHYERCFPRPVQTIGMDDSITSNLTLEAWFQRQSNITAQQHNGTCDW